jgi:hypothetical protein
MLLTSAPVRPPATGHSQIAAGPGRPARHVDTVLNGTVDFSQLFLRRAAHDGRSQSTRKRASAAPAEANVSSRSPVGNCKAPPAPPAKLRPLRLEAAAPKAKRIPETTSPYDRRIRFHALPARLAGGERRRRPPPTGVYRVGSARRLDRAFTGKDMNPNRRCPYEVALFSNDRPKQSSHDNACT